SWPAAHSARVPPAATRPIPASRTAADLRPAPPGAVISSPYRTEPPCTWRVRPGRPAAGNGPCPGGDFLAARVGDPQLAGSPSPDTADRNLQPRSPRRGHVAHRHARQRHAVTRLDGLPGDLA